MYKETSLARGVSLPELLEFGANQSRPRPRAPAASQWNRIKDSPAFTDLSTSATPSYFLLFDSCFPALAAHNLADEIARLRHCRSLYFSIDAASPALTALCEAFLLFSGAPASFLAAFARFDWIPLLAQVLDVDRSRPAELVLQTFSNCAQGSSDLAGLLAAPVAFGRIRECFDSPSRSLQQHSLFCLSCLCDRANPASLAEVLFCVLAGAIQSPHFFEMAVRGLSRLSFHRPDLIVANGYVTSFLMAIHPGADVVNECCLFAIQNSLRFDRSAVAPLLFSHGIVELFAAALGRPVSHRTAAIVRMIGAIVCEAPAIANMVARSEVIAKLHWCLFKGQYALKAAAIEFVAVLLELSSVYRLGVIETNVFSVLAAAADSVNAALAVRVLNGIEKAVVGIERERREILFSDLACLFESSPRDMDEELAAGVRQLRACLPVEI
jgi:hypothetical protein